MPIIRSFFFLALFLATISNAQASDELKTYLLKLNDLKNFPYHLLDEQYRAYYKMGPNNLTVGKKEVKQLNDQQLKSVKFLEVKNLKILNQTDTEFFTSVVYEYDWASEMGGTKMNGKLIVHSIL